VCTHFIQPCGTPTLQRLGLSDAIEAVGAFVTRSTSGPKPAGSSEATTIRTASALTASPSGARSSIPCSVPFEKRRFEGTTWEQFEWRGPESNRGHHDFQGPQRPG